MLNKIRDNYGARVKRVRVGRGIGSGLGKTCGSGQKGQKSRTGVAIKGFEGGQMPLTRRLPKRGFRVVPSKTDAIINLGRIQSAIDSGRLSPAALVDLTTLKSAGLVRREVTHVRVLASGVLKAKIQIEAQAASEAAKQAIAQVGGTLSLVGAA